MASNPPLRAIQARHPLWTLFSGHTGVIASVGLVSGAINRLALGSSFICCRCTIGSCHRNRLQR
jgi:hypothetical protein